jgi:general secretion pathway protein N
MAGAAMKVATGLSIATVLATAVISPMTFGDRLKPMIASLETPPAGLGQTAPELGAGRAAAPVTAPAETISNPLLAIPLAALAATREKPLFSVTRRPPPPVVAAAPEEAPKAAPPPPPAPERPTLTLIGTIEGPLRPIALFQDAASSEVISAPLGAIAGGWKVIAVAHRSATLEKGDRTVALEIPRLEASPSPAPEAPPLTRRVR